jgi:hypothetical protein
MRSFYNIKAFIKDVKVYDENLPFTRIEPNEEDIRGFIRLTRSTTIKESEIEGVEWIYLRELTDLEL